MPSILKDVFDEMRCVCEDFNFVILDFVWPIIR